METILEYTARTPQDVDAPWKVSIVWTHHLACHPEWHYGDKFLCTRKCCRNLHHQSCKCNDWLYGGASLPFWKARCSNLYAR